MKYQCLSIFNIYFDCCNLQYTLYSIQYTQYTKYISIPAVSPSHPALSPYILLENAELLQWRSRPEWIEGGGEMGGGKKRKGKEDVGGGEGPQFYLPPRIPALHTLKN